MKILSGTVQDGRIVVDDETLPEGEKVTVLAPENEESFEVSADEKRILLESLAQAARGDFVDSDQLLRELDEPG
jgi:hypothetical protein